MYVLRFVFDINYIIIYYIRLILILLSKLMYLICIAVRQKNEIRFGIYQFIHIKNLILRAKNILQAKI